MILFCHVTLSLQSWILSCNIIFTKLNIVLWYCLYKVWYIFWRGIVGETWAFRPPRLQLETFQTFFIFRQISPFPQSLSPLSLLSLHLTHIPRGIILWSQGPSGKVSGKKVAVLLEFVWMRGGALPKLFVTFSWVHFWAIKGMYFLQNANNFDFELFF